jgi:hypothetical protein
MFPVLAPDRHYGDRAGRHHIVDVDRAPVVLHHAVRIRTTMVDSHAVDGPVGVAPRPNDSVLVEDGRVAITLPPISWTALSLSTR